MKKTDFILILLLVIAISCKKESRKEQPVQVASIPNYGKLAVGNYWIYQRFKVDSIGSSTPQNIYDSCYISKDTLINGKTYFEMYRPNFFSLNLYSYVRDSSTYIVDHKGRMQFSSTDFSTIFHTGYSTAGPTDTIAFAIVKMNNKDSVVNTPMGAFTTSNSQVIHYMYPAWRDFYDIRYNNTCYAENIGIVLETLSINYTDPYSYERRIVRYHVN